MMADRDEDLLGLEVRGSNMKGVYAIQKEGVAVEAETSDDAGVDAGANGSVGSKVVLPVSKRKPPGIASIEPAAIDNEQRCAESRVPAIAFVILVQVRPRQTVATRKQICFGLVE